MRYSFYVLFLLILFASCSKEVYKVVKYSNFDKENEIYKDYLKTDSQYYVIKNSNYYYVMSSDSIIHFKKLTYVGKIDGYDRTLVKLDNGRKVFLDAYLDNGYFNDMYVYVNVRDYHTEEELYRFVLDYDDKVDSDKLEGKLAQIDK